MSQCNYYSYNLERCTDQAQTGSDFCDIHDYVRDVPGIFSLNEQRRQRAHGNSPYPVPVKIKAKVKAHEPRAQVRVKTTPIKAKIRVRPALTREQCEKWRVNVTINPITDRMIKVNGPTFKKFQAACVSHGIDIGDVDVDVENWKDVYNCNNDSDPVSGQQYAQLQEDEIKDLIRLGSGMCYPLDTLYGWYKAKVQGSEEGTVVTVTDPMVPSYVLTSDEIAIINRYADEYGYSRPKHKKTTRAPPGYRLEIDQDWTNTVDFHKIYVIAPNGSRRVIGVLPMNIDGGGVTSYSVLQKIYDAWNRGFLMPHNNPALLTGLSILDATADQNALHNYHWWTTGEGIIDNLQKLDTELDFRFWENM